MKEARHKRRHTIWLNLHKTLGNLIYSDRKPISGCLETGVERKMNCTGHSETLRDNGNVLYLDYGDSFTGIYIAQN